ncbi:hypothetical protein BDF22DRAFT_690109 [Syncephalis plumigaleata]|nr:hypothetical protein BDF22DRAFT_690109 [Syncephalis plumigaleata]
MSQLALNEGKATYCGGYVVLVYRSIGSDQVLVGLRKGKHGEGYWQFPGGALEFGESFEECAKHRTRNDDIRVISCFNVIFQESNKHCVAVFVRGVCQDSTAEPQNMEPEKNAGWQWTTIAEIRASNSQFRPLFGGTPSFLAYLQEQNDPDGQQLVYRA